MEIINRGRAYSCKFGFYKGELRKVKEHVQLTHISEDRHQYFCLNLLGNQRGNWTGISCTMPSINRLGRGWKCPVNSQQKKITGLSGKILQLIGSLIVRETAHSYPCWTLSSCGASACALSPILRKLQLRCVRFRRQTLHLCLSSRRFLLMFRRWDL